MPPNTDTDANTGITHNIADLLDALPPAGLRLLRAAAQRPGIRLLDADPDSAHSTRRTAAADLRHRGLVYPSKPALVLVHPDAALAVDADPIDYALLRFDGIEQGAAITRIVDMVPGATVHAVTKRLLALRESGVLQPWDGLVLTPWGVQVASGIQDLSLIKPQRWKTPTP